MTAKADVGRSTYFRYFKSKDEVLAFKLVTMWKRYAEQNKTDKEARFAVITHIFQYFLSIRSTNDLLYEIQLQNVLLQSYLEIMIPTFQDNSLEDYYENNFLAYGLYGLMNAWILRGYKETPQQMTEIVNQFSAKLIEKELLFNKE